MQKTTGVQIMIRSQKRYSDQRFESLKMDQTEIASSDFHECVFERCSFIEGGFQSCRIVGCTFKECDLSLLRIPGSVFSTTRFEDSKIIGVNWTEADWSGTNLGEPLGFYNCNLRHSTFIGLNLQRIQIKDCAALEVDFREADLSQANFGGSDLAGSLFLNTNLTGADLSRARSYNIAPDKNKLSRARFSLPEAISLLHNLDIVLEEGKST